jgi:putative transposase
MSRFRKLSHTIWHCQYHLVWVPKYRYRILSGGVGHEVGRCIRSFSEQKRCEIIEMNIQIDHVHLLVMIPPKVSVSDYVGIVKGRTAIRVFNKFRNLKRKPYWGNHFWAKGYCVDTVGLDEEKIRKYVKHQEVKERQLKLI